MSATITELADQSLECGEGPVWDPDGQRLFWTDSGGTTVFSLTEGANEPAIVNEGLHVASLTRHASGGLMLCGAGGFYHLGPDGDIRIVADTCDGRALEHIKVCQEHLAKHDMFVGAFYFKSKQFRAARARFEDVLKTYPDVGVHRTALEYVALCDAFIDRQEARAEELRREEQEERQEEAEKYKKKLAKERERAEKKGVGQEVDEEAEPVSEP